MSSAPLRVGMVGVGTISAQYFASFEKLPNLQLVAVADINEERAREVAAEHGVDARSVDDLFASDDIDAVLNLTIPATHVDVGLRAIEHGKHVFAEKPLGLSVTEARPLVEAADAAGVLLGSAPDTVLGTGIQTARAVIDDGVIGDVLGASVHWSAPGHERWHPNPAFYYQPGGGPLLDMGPYYITSLVTLFGPIIRVSGLATRSDRPRTVATGPQAGTPIPVAIDTHVTALLEHESGVSSQITVSFEVWATRSPLFEVYGTKGTLAVPDPNRFNDPVEVYTADTAEWRAVPETAGYRDSGRGYGLAELAEALHNNRQPRASGALALHVLDVMESIARAADERSVVTLHTTVERPETVPLSDRPEASENS
ncbi:Gfo/Idh/MocA family protein [Curtobacterium ammoniigenes]|uniref:Gfo/Idh/MocA family protein n=1 Tax=Curtobacterium ammoniigenes TaxID=395387 RepID=UPI0008344E74|nr:Gfo/Idh/MocA family oxidoreductase [Curtobacterium ammoniigenes]